LNGNTGIEYVYDEKLRGLLGKNIYEVDASGRVLQE
jgi:cell division protein FtsI/penicillin-binding protein 2